MASRLRLCHCARQLFRQVLPFLLLLHKFGGYFNRHIHKVFQYLLDITILNLVNDRGKTIVVFFLRCLEVRIHYGNFYLVACFLLNQSDYRCVLCHYYEAILVYLTKISEDAKYLRHRISKSLIIYEIWKFDILFIP